MGCVYYERADGIVLVDPVAPPETTPDADRFWRALDRDVARIARPVAIVSTSIRRARSADPVRRRYAATPGISTDTPPGIVAHAMSVAVDLEIAYWIEEHGALVFGGAVTGPRPGVLEVDARYREGVAPLLDLPIAMVLVSEGIPVLEGGRAALAAAVAGARDVGQSDS